MKLALAVFVALGVTMAWQASVVADYQQDTTGIAPGATANTVIQPTTAYSPEQRS